MSSAKILRIKNFANVGITAKSAKILLRENFTLYGIQVYRCMLLCISVDKYVCTVHALIFVWFYTRGIRGLEIPCESIDILLHYVESSRQ